MKKTEKRILSISLWNCPDCPVCPHFQKYIRNLNSWRKDLKSRTIGTKRTNQTILGILTEFRLRRCDAYHKWCKVGGVSRYIETVQIIYFFEYPSLTLGSFNASK